MACELGVDCFEAWIGGVFKACLASEGAGYSIRSQ